MYAEAQLVRVLKSVLPHPPIYPQHNLFIKNIVLYLGQELLAWVVLGSCSSSLPPWLTLFDAISTTANRKPRHAGVRLQNCTFRVNLPESVRTQVILGLKPGMACSSSIPETSNTNIKSNSLVPPSLAPAYPRNQTSTLMRGGPETRGIRHSLSCRAIKTFFENCENI